MILEYNYKYQFKDFFNNYLILTKIEFRIHQSTFFQF